MNFLTTEISKIENPENNEKLEKVEPQNGARTHQESKTGNCSELISAKFQELRKEFRCYPKNIERLQEFTKKLEHRLKSVI